jgi:hypothetical protein
MCVYIMPIMRYNGGMNIPYIHGISGDACADREFIRNTKETPLDMSFNLSDE